MPIENYLRSPSPSGRWADPVQINHVPLCIVRKSFTAGNMALIYGIGASWGTLLRMLTDDLATLACCGTTVLPIIVHATS